MKIFLIVFLISVLSAGQCRAEIPSSAVRFRPPESLCTAAQWEVCGAPLVAVEGENRVAYVPLRRRGTLWDEGAVRKVSLGGMSPERVLWQTASLLPRNVLRPAFQNKTFAGGAAEPLEKFDPSLAEVCGLNRNRWNEASALLRNKKMGAPFPASMVLAEGFLYVLCDDGILCALSTVTGRCLWNYLLPQACCRMKAVLEGHRSRLPWLCAGGLTAEKDNDGELLLWGTLGEGGRGLYCLRPRPTDAELLWAKETFDQGTFAEIAAFAGPDELGLTEAAPLAARLWEKDVLVLPSGSGVPGRLLFFDALLGKLETTVNGFAGHELVLTPLGFADKSGTLSRILCCDSLGGIQEFVRQGGSWQADSRADLRSLCGLNDLEPRFSPMVCRTRKGLTAVFVAEGTKGTVVAASSVHLKNARWGKIPRKSATYGWWQLCEGFSSPFAALCYDGLLYLAGWQEGRRTLLVIDVTSGEAVLSSRLSESVRSLTVFSGSVAAVMADGSVLTVKSLAGSEPLEAARRRYGVVYTLRH
ncbi:MAG: hypothetical protein ACOYD9_04010 [Pyramidobacter sp.]|jgi:hypothetical protein